MAETANNETIQEESLNDEQKGVLSNLKSIIDDALDNLQDKFKRPDVHIMSEGDFEWRLARQLDIELRRKKNKLNNFSVHTQVTWLNEGEPDCNKAVDDKNRIVDILILDMTKFKPIKGEEGKNSKKGSQYNGISFAIELKFLRPDTSVNNSEIDNDFAKRKSLEDKSWLYIVPLIDDSKGGYKDKEETIKGKYDIVAKGRNDIFYMPLIIHPSVESKER